VIARVACECGTGSDTPVVLTKALCMVKRPWQVFGAGAAKCSKQGCPGVLSKCECVRGFYLMRLLY
jgi:hypothetical protein